jgi:hypothetical protein
MEILPRKPNRKHPIKQASLKMNSNQQYLLKIILTKLQTLPSIILTLP